MATGCVSGEEGSVDGGVFGGGAVCGTKIFIFTRRPRLVLGIAGCRVLCVYGKKASSPENYNPPPSSDEVNNVWGCISTLQDDVFRFLIAEIFVPFFLGNCRSFRGISINLVALGCVLHI